MLGMMLPIQSRRKMSIETELDGADDEVEASKNASERGRTKGRKTRGVTLALPQSPSEAFPPALAVSPTCCIPPQTPQIAPVGLAPTPLNLALSTSTPTPSGIPRTTHLKQAVWFTNATPSVYEYTPCSIMSSPSPLLGYSEQPGCTTRRAGHTQQFCMSPIAAQTPMASAVPSGYSPGLSVTNPERQVAAASLAPVFVRQSRSAPYPVESAASPVMSPVVSPTMMSPVRQQAVGTGLFAYCRPAQAPAPTPMLLPGVWPAHTPQPRPQPQRLAEQPQVRPWYHPSWV